MELQIILVQHDIITNKPVDNINKIRGLLNQSKFEGNSKSSERLIFLPELFTAGYGDFANIRQIGINFNDPNETGKKQINEMQSLAKDFNGTIFGTIPEFDNNNLYNSMIRITANRIDILYRKIHLFGAMDESVYFKSGKKLILIALSTTYT